MWISISYVYVAKFRWILCYQNYSATILLNILGIEIIYFITDVSYKANKICEKQNCSYVSWYNNY